MLVVVEHAQAELADLRVGGVDVDHVDLRLGQRVIRQAVVETDRPGLEAITLHQPWPAVAAADEFVGQAELQLAVPCQIAQALDAQPLRIGLAHRQRIPIVEAQRDGRA